MRLTTLRASAAVCECVSDRGKNVVGPGKRVIIPEAHHTIAATLEPLSTSGVSRIVLAMLTAIDLDDERRLGTEEVDDVTPDGLLATKTESVDLFSA